ncbi:MAG: hypothetical protein A2271_02375 [Candidatus Moranbacteria bacterium RIFOXYA12_FULL_35_19]|nr:MAG: hypothetical protein A2343_00915 [Candidatus Moranbacteria bacterium RIFOXYB12_FULL_35_8]OGI35385.1 MAG: hypothetical protein A2271_02375 [Candidatus Moranbacteria bacterium RIFOXYA12_FULL_35_19]
MDWEILSWLQEYNALRQQKRYCAGQGARFFNKENIRIICFWEILNEKIDEGNECKRTDKPPERSSHSYESD